MKYSLRSLMMAAFDDPQESRFRRQLKKRVSEPSPNYGMTETALRWVFEEQVDLPNLLHSDNLIENGPDLPIEEILEDALELLGVNALPVSDSWNGTFGDLVRVLNETVDKSHRESRPRAKLNTP